VSLTAEERVALLRTLDDAPPGLNPLQQRLREQAKKRPSHAHTDERRRHLERQATRELSRSLPRRHHRPTRGPPPILEVGAEILDGWVVSHLPQMNLREVGGKRLSFDVWVDKKGSDELNDKLELHQGTIRLADPDRSRRVWDVKGGGSIAPAARGVGTTSLWWLP
jgi:hypothetical protein